jgi:hypothetical protein
VRSKAGALAEFDAAAAEFGKVSGPHVRVTGTAVHLGVSSGENATDAIALASKVDSLFATLKTILNGVSAAGPTGAALSLAANAAWPTGVPSTASAVVKSK